MGTYMVIYWGVLLLTWVTALPLELIRWEQWLKDPNLLNRDDRCRKLWCRKLILKWWSISYKHNWCQFVFDFHGKRESLARDWEVQIRHAWREANDIVPYWLFRIWYFKVRGGFFFGAVFPLWFYSDPSFRLVYFMELIFCPFFS